MLNILFQIKQHKVEFDTQSSTTVVRLSYSNERKAVTPRKSISDLQDAHVGSYHINLYENSQAVT